MIFINLTNSPVFVYNFETQETITVEPDSEGCEVPSLSLSEQPISTVNGVPVYQASIGKVKLPPPIPFVMYIVYLDVAMMHPERRDLVFSASIMGTLGQVQLPQQDAQQFMDDVRWAVHHAAHATLHPVLSGLISSTTRAAVEDELCNRIVDRTMARLEERGH